MRRYAVFLFLTTFIRLIVSCASKLITLVNIDNKADIFLTILKSQLLKKLYYNDEIGAIT